MPWKVPRIWEFEVPEEVIQRVLTKELPPSAYSPYMHPIHNKHVIGVNAAFLIGQYITSMLLELMQLS